MKQWALERLGLCLEPSDVPGSSPSTEERVCEGLTISLNCVGRGSGSINILDASFGRQHGPDVCPHSATATSNQACHETRSTLIVQAACQGQATCSIDASRRVFGDPCKGIYKYLTINYNCGTVGL
ncbi:Gal_Lectin-domain-containing protein [Fragilariopsis cylindrus CCMP1102]|uniref:Gal_Lectin-domain-containing protein n=1 Tax=Fragilariopsis cylindrus CCMP1102 TaxID=635003 RepID=A0A1E7F1J2_9STRA|nr:Gal_Lectin-domain-containing protein [Fragilariopsis cylindrus CCMP1102]|eukprot:OEU12071.1 Gal_Lectin-domain-containing protein [Fragilariopsis cylindrus CCMP1102]